jgi:predicted RNase H-like HicB family nuclease
LKEIPGIFSQGKSLDELEENIRDAYALMIEEEASVAHPRAKTIEVNQFEDRVWI